MDHFLEFGRLIAEVVPLIAISVFLLCLGWWLEQWDAFSVIDKKWIFVVGLISLCMVVVGWSMFLHFQHWLDYPDLLGQLDPNLFSVPWWVGWLSSTGYILALVGALFSGAVARRTRNEIARFF
uniref:Uncharacterized protein n=1 Tax=mine drainage metagenome TaxID=410659 RepID=E6Q2R2_9ZZZZ